MEDHESRKQPVGPPVNVVAILREELARARRDRSGRTLGLVLQDAWRVSRSVHGRKQRAAEHVRAPVVGIQPIQERDQRRAAGVVAGVPARAGDSAAELQTRRDCRRGTSDRTWRRRTRCASSPSSSRTTVTFGMRVAACHSAVRSQPSPNARWLQEDDIGPRRRADAREHFRQLAEAGRRARALRMREEDQRRPVSRRARACSSTASQRTGSPRRPGLLSYAQTTHRPPAAETSHTATHAISQADRFTDARFWESEPRRSWINI